MGWISESGIKRSITSGLGIDISRTFSLAISASLNWGAYNYNRSFTEHDINNKYNVLDKGPLFTNTDFNKVTVTDSLSQEFTGVNAKLGLLYKVKEWARLGLTITLPKVLTVTENFSRNANSEFDNHNSYSFSENGRNTYTTYSPWIFALGFSAITECLILSGNLEYSDYSQLSFDNRNTYNVSLNNEIIKTLGEQISYGIGAEYTFNEIPRCIRAGYSKVGTQH